MKKIFLVGYYGENNYGDDLLLKTVLKILTEIGFDGMVYIPFEEDSKHLYEHVNFEVQKVNKMDLLSFNKIIKSVDVVIYGGGNLFQSETSLKSFYYYYFIYKLSVKNNIPVLLLSQGFGGIKHKIAQNILKKMFKYENLYGVYRDNTSCVYAKKNKAKNSYLGVDIAPYYFDEKVIIKKEKISICLKNDYFDLKPLIDFVSIFDNYEISSLIINSNQDTMMNYNFVEMLRKQKNLKVLFPFKDFDKINQEIQESSIIISDRLHSSLIGMYFGAVILSYKNSKNVRVLKNISEDYNFFYKKLNELPFIYSEFVNSNFDFKIMSINYKIRLESTVNEIKKIIQNVL